MMKEKLKKYYKYLLIYIIVYFLKFTMYENASQLIKLLLDLSVAGVDILFFGYLFISNIGEYFFENFPKNEKARSFIISFVKWLAFVFALSGVISIFIVLFELWKIGF